MSCIIDDTFVLGETNESLPVSPIPDVSFPFLMYSYARAQQQWLDPTIISMLFNVIAIDFAVLASFDRIELNRIFFLRKKKL